MTSLLFVRTCMSECHDARQEATSATAPRRVAALKDVIACSGCCAFKFPSSSSFCLFHSSFFTITTSTNSAQHQLTTSNKSF